jgi:hypothetical protein
VSDLRVSDEEILAMTPAERRELILRLTPAPRGIGPSARTVEQIRKWRLALMVVCLVTLIPWIVYLANTLPDHYVARNWVATWVGFDVLLLVMLTATAITGWRRRQLLFPTAFASGVLLVCDAWFDVMTSHHGRDLIEALLSALVIELPLAFILVAGPLRLLRYVAIRHGLVDPDVRMWRVPIPMPELWPDRRIPPN